MAKSAVVGITAVAVIIGAGYYTHSMLAPPNFHSAQGGGPSLADQAIFKKSYSPGTINITPSKSNSSTIQHNQDSFIATGMNVHSAIINAFPDYQMEQVILGSNMPQDRKDIVITVPAGHPEQLNEILHTEVPKAYGVTTREDERDINVMVMTAPQGDARMEKAQARARRAQG